MEDYYRMQVDAFALKEPTHGDNSKSVMNLSILKWIMNQISKLLIKSRRHYHCTTSSNHMSILTNTSSGASQVECQGVDTQIGETMSIN